MGKPKAESTTMAEIAKIFQFSSTENPQSFNEAHGQVLAFPAVKYYPSAELVLKNKRRTIQSKGLLDFLKVLGISPDIAQHYFQEICVYNKQTQETLKTLGFPNEDEGWELVNPFFKGTIGTQSISFIRGTHDKPESIHIFKEILDYLAFLSKLGAKKIVADVVILHANNCIQQINPYIQNYGYKQIYSWMNNDQSGLDARNYIQQIANAEEELKHKAMNKLYKPFKNLQAWHQYQINHLK